MDKQKAVVGFEQFAQHLAKRNGGKIEDSRDFIRNFELAIDYFCGQEDCHVRLNTGTYAKVKRHNCAIEQITFRQNMKTTRKVRVRISESYY